jgi:putative endonuclease
VTTDPRHLAGQRAEDAAAAFLQAQGLVLLQRNYRCRMGELDLIAQQAPDVLVIAEVRLRSRLDYGGGAASVDARKRLRIVRTSRHLLMKQPQLARLRVRFDVLDLHPQGDGHHIDWLRGAFDAA